MNDNTGNGSDYITQQATLNGNTTTIQQPFTKEQLKCIIDLITETIKSEKQQKKEERRWYQNLLVPSFAVIVASVIGGLFTYCSSKIPQEYNVRIAKIEESIKDLQDNTNNLNIDTAVIKTKIENIKS